ADRSKGVTAAVRLLRLRPALAGQQDVVQEGIAAAAGLHGLRPVFPKPAHGVREESSALLAAVAALAPYVVHLVADESEGALHHLVRHPPVAAVDVLVRAPVLEEDADRLRLIFADEGRVAVRAAQADVGADGAEDAAELVRSFPGGGEGADGAAAPA